MGIDREKVELKRFVFSLWWKKKKLKETKLLK